MGSTDSEEQGHCGYTPGAQHYTPIWGAEDPGNTQLFSFQKSEKAVTHGKLCGRRRVEGGSIQ
jgi:hypothetical protein